MSAPRASRHRAPATPRHGAQTPTSRWSGLLGVRGAHSRRYRLRRRLLTSATVTAVGLGLIAAPGLLGDAWDEAGFGPIVDVPSDRPDLGLVYQGLAPAGDGEPCVGAYELDDADICSHGPDPAPPGLNVKADVRPVARTAPAPALPRRDTARAPRERELLADAGAVAPSESSPALAPAAVPAGTDVPEGPGGVVCAGDGQTGDRVQVLYVYEAGTASRYSQYLASFREWAAGVDAIYDASAQETGGTRRLRYVTTAECEVEVREVQLPEGALADFNATIDRLKKLAFNRTDRKYMIFAEANVYCGIGTFVKDDTAGPSNDNNQGPSYGRTDAGCWSAFVAAHELGHNLGAVQESAPNSTKLGHCHDDHDLMCYEDSDETVVEVICRDSEAENRLDCNHDDYFDTNPGSGSYLDTHWNVADSSYLIDTSADGDAAPEPTTGPGGPAGPASATPTAGPAPTVEPSPGPSATAGPGPTGAPSPTPSATAAPGATGPPPGPAPNRLTVSGTTSTSTWLSWPAAAARTRYTVVVDGRKLGKTAATRIRVIGLQPDASYQMHVSVRDAAGALRAHTETVTVRTEKAAQPAAGRAFLLGNALTGGAAHLYGARDADGTPLVLGAADGAANQRWELRSTGDGHFLLRSTATGKCAAPHGDAVVGAVVVQQACDLAEDRQHWHAVRSGHGFTVTAGEAALVIGVSRLRYGDAHLLVLQRQDEARYQSWSALPA